jgi:hypothetical protein
MMKKIFLVLFLMPIFVFSQNVGIGTTTPVAYGKLHVHDEISIQDASIVLTNSLTGTAALRGARFRMLNSDLFIANDETAGNLRLSTNFNTRLLIDASGNVGIGTLSPGTKLHVFDQQNTVAGKIETENGSFAGLELKAGGTNNNYFRILKNNPAGGNGTLLQTGADAGSLTLETAAGSPIVMNTEGFERMRIWPNSANGAIGIGTSGLPLGKVDIRNTASAINPHLIIVENQSDNFARLRFANNNQLSRFWDINTLNGSAGAAGDRFAINHSSGGDAIVVNGLGKVGIGTGLIDAKLEIAHNSSRSEPSFKIRETENDTVRVEFSNTNVGDNWYLDVYKPSSVGNGTFSIRSGNNQKFSVSDNGLVKLPGLAGGGSNRTLAVDNNGVIHHKGSYDRIFNGFDFKHVSSANPVNVNFTNGLFYGTGSDSLVTTIDFDFTDLISYTLYYVDTDPGKRIKVTLHTTARQHTQPVLSYSEMATDGGTLHQLLTLPPVSADHTSFIILSAVDNAGNPTTWSSNLQVKSLRVNYYN